MTENFNGLTPAEVERLAMLSEEAGEIVQAAAMVILYGENGPHNDLDRLVSLEAECADLLAIGALMAEDIMRQGGSEVSSPDPWITTKAPLDHQMAMLASSAGRIVQAVGKILRHGYESYHPMDPSTTNRELLANELDHCIKVMDILSEDLLPGVAEPITEIIAKKMRYTHHQELV